MLNIKAGDICRLAPVTGEGEEELVEITGISDKHQDRISYRYLVVGGRGMKTWTHGHLFAQRYRGRVSRRCE